jgi:hypothetical protein
VSLLIDDSREGWDRRIGRIAAPYNPHAWYGWAVEGITGTYDRDSGGWMVFHGHELIPIDETEEVLAEWMLQQLSV